MNHPLLAQPLNWTDAEAGLTSEVMGAYLAAARTIFTLVRDRLGT